MGGYWLVTKQDGTMYRFGYDPDSEVYSNTGRDYAVKWLLDRVEDANGNMIYYEYSQNPYDEDSGAAYLSSIKYDADMKREVRFGYESSLRPDRRRIYEQGNLIDESRRLTDVSVYVDDVLVRRNSLSYVLLNSALSAVSKITLFGDDNSSSLFNISFDYYVSKPGYTNQTAVWKPTAMFSDSSHIDYGVRQVDVNNDGFVDIVQTSLSSNYTWINDKNSNWILDNAWNLPVYIVNGGEG